MLRQLVAAALVCALGASTSMGEIIVSVGDIELLPNLANQTFPIAVTRTAGETVQGLNFRIRIGDGTGGPDYDHPGPKVKAVSLIGAGTVFELNHQDLTNVASYSYSWRGSVTTSAGSIIPDGDLAYVTFDTTGMDISTFTGPWDVFLKDRSNNNTDFAGVPATLRAGTVSIVPEPGTGLLALCMAGGAITGALLRRNRARVPA